MVVSECCRGYGYLNLRTFIASADGQLTNAFADFRAQGVTDLIIDFRYNGGGLVSTANLLGDLLGAGRAGQIFSPTRFRPSKSAAEDDDHRLPPGAPHNAPTPIPLPGTGTT